MKAALLPPAISEVVAEVRAVYHALSGRPVARDCCSVGDCCRFRLTGKTPHLTKAEAIVAARAWRATGRTELAGKGDGSCPILDDATGRCRIYADRPMGCRTHFCAAAGGPYARREVADLIHRLEDLSIRLGSTEAQPLEAAIRLALKACK